MSAAIQALREYGQCIRGYWGDIDGRTVRDNLNLLADELEAPTGLSIEYWRSEFDMCLDGRGHWGGAWRGYCTDYSCPSVLGDDA